MSVINQVLNQLEQRGAQIATGQSVRPVHVGRDTHTFKWIIVSVVLFVVPAVIVWRTLSPGVAELPKSVVTGTMSAASAVMNTAALPQPLTGQMPASHHGLESRPAPKGHGKNAATDDANDSLTDINLPERVRSQSGDVQADKSQTSHASLPDGTTDRATGETTSQTAKPPAEEILAGHSASQVMGYGQSAKPVSGQAALTVADGSVALSTSVEKRSDGASDKVHEGQDSQREFRVKNQYQKKNASSSVHQDNQAATASVQLAGREQATANMSGQPIKQVSQAQQADAQFRKAVAFVQQGRVSDAQSGFEAALRIDAGHEAARQALVALLLENNRGGEAEQVLQDGLRNKPAHSEFAMLLARLQIQRNDLDLAITTLENTLSHAVQQADYQAFYAALLQRKSRHAEAAEHYQLALKAVPNKGIWLMGYGISLQALARFDEAKRAYERALETRTLSPELQTFVQKKIREL